MPWPANFPEFLFRVGIWIFVNSNSNPIILSLHLWLFGSDSVGVLWSLSLTLNSFNSEWYLWDTVFTRIVMFWGRVQ
jgi:hypothetical protein